jgi:guanosine-3',5'-bis(diphosphate) 3'-pyrophosphohydrolase
MHFANLLQSITFAAEKHTLQRRKDVAASPYINHPIAVATILAVEEMCRTR